MNTNVMLLNSVRYANLPLKPSPFGGSVSETYTFTHSSGTIILEGVVLDKLKSGLAKFMSYDWRNTKYALYTKDDDHIVVVQKRKEFEVVEFFGGKVSQKKFSLADIDKYITDFVQQGFVLENKRRTATNIARIAQRFLIPIVSISVGGFGIYVILSIMAASMVSNGMQLPDLIADMFSNRDYIKASIELFTK